MPGVKLILLPGLDGTGTLFGPLLGALAPSFEPEVVRYPPNTVLPPEALAALVRTRLPRQPEKWLLLGESFSGHIALALAAEAAVPPCGVVLVASFHRPPLTGVLAACARHAPAWMFARPPPRALVRTLLAGSDASEALVTLVTSTLSEVSAGVLADRVRQTARVDATAAARKLTLPVLYLQGSKDRLVSPRSAQWLARDLPQLQVEVIDGPHLLSQTRFEQMAARLETFAATCARG